MCGGRGEGGAGEGKEAKRLTRFGPSSSAHSIHWLEPEAHISHNGTFWFPDWTHKKSALCLRTVIASAGIVADGLNNLNVVAV